MLTVRSHNCCLTAIQRYRQHYDANPIDSDSEMGDAFRAGNNAAEIMMEIRASRGWQRTEDIDDRKNAESIVRHARIFLSVSCHDIPNDVPNPSSRLTRFNIETLAVDSTVPLRVNFSCLTKSSFPPFHSTATPTLIEAGPNHSNISCPRRHDVGQLSTSERGSS